MSGFWSVAVALVAVGAGVAAWVVVDLRRRAGELDDAARRCRELAAQAAALGVDARRLRARLATVEVAVASRRRRDDG